jgi:hypothetical protein
VKLLEPRRHPSIRMNIDFRKDRGPAALEFFGARVSKLRTIASGIDLLMNSCMPCSFGLLPHPRSGTRAQPTGLLEVTVADRWIPPMTAAYGTRVARPARTTTLAPGGDGSQLGQRVRSVLGVTTVSWARGRRARGRLRIKPVTVQAFSQRSRKVTAVCLGSSSGPRQSRGLHQMPEHACRWNLAPGLEQRRRVVPGHDVGSSDKGGTNRDFAGPWLRSRLSRPNRLLQFPATMQLNDTIPERWIQAESPTQEGQGYPNVIVPGQEWRRAGLLDPAPGHGTRSDKAIWLRGELLER